jgi:hypothetical protein
MKNVTNLPTMLLSVAILTFLSWAYISGVYVQLYDRLTTQNKRIALASLFCVFFSSIEHGCRATCLIFNVLEPSLLRLLEFGNSVFQLCWFFLTLLEMQDTMFTTFHKFKKKEF